MLSMFTFIPPYPHHFSTLSAGQNLMTQHRTVLLPQKNIPCPFSLVCLDSFSFPEGLLILLVFGYMFWRPFPPQRLKSVIIKIHFTTSNSDLDLFFLLNY